MFILWIKALHIIAVISWMAGLLYLPRLLVYHVDATTGSELSEQLKVMERRLLRVIMTPSMILTWALGFWLAELSGVWSEIWFILKFLLVVLLTVFHILLSKWVREFASDSNFRSARFYRNANEVPTVLMIFIIVFVVVRPF